MPLLLLEERELSNVPLLLPLLSYERVSDAPLSLVREPESFIVLLLSLLLEELLLPDCELLDTSPGSG